MWDLEGRFGFLGGILYFLGVLVLRFYFLVNDFVGLKFIGKYLFYFEYVN